MANFNLNDYETVDERIQRFRRDHKEARIETTVLAYEGEVGKTRWIVRAEVYRTADAERPAGVGHAFENDGQGMANKTSALENAETSAVGRALAQAGYSGSKRTTREEMGKVLIPELTARIAAATSKDETREIWQEASRNGVLGQVEKLILDRNDAIVKAGESGD